MSEQHLSDREVTEGASLYKVSEEQQNDSAVVEGATEIEMSEQQPGDKKITEEALHLRMSEQESTRMTETILEEASPPEVTETQDMNKHEITREMQQDKEIAKTHKDCDDKFKILLRKEKIPKIKMINTFRTMTKMNKRIQKKKVMKRLKISPRLIEAREEIKRMGEKSVLLLMKKLIEMLPSTKKNLNQQNSNKDTDEDHEVQEDLSACLSMLESITLSNNINNEMLEKIEKLKIDADQVKIKDDIDTEEDDLWEEMNLGDEELERINYLEKEMIKKYEEETDRKSMRVEEDEAQEVLHDPEAKNKMKEERPSLSKSTKIKMDTSQDQGEGEKHEDHKEETQVPQDPEEPQEVPQDPEDKEEMKKENARLYNPSTEAKKRDNQNQDEQTLEEDQQDIEENEDTVVHHDPEEEDTSLLDVTEKESSDSPTIPSPRSSPTPARKRMRKRTPTKKTRKTPSSTKKNKIVVRKTEKKKKTPPKDTTTNAKEEKILPWSTCEDETRRASQVQQDPEAAEAPTMTPEKRWSKKVINKLFTIGKDTEEEEKFSSKVLQARMTIEERLRKEQRDKALELMRKRMILTPNKKRNRQEDGEWEGVGQQTSGQQLVRIEEGVRKGLPSHQGGSKPQ